MKNNCRYGIIREEIKIKGVVIMTVKLIEKTKDGEKSRNVEIEKMNGLQVLRVAKGISDIVKFVNQNDKLQNASKTFISIREEELKNAEAYYEEARKGNKKVANIDTYDVGGIALKRTGVAIWNDILGMVGDLLGEIPEKIYEILSNASGIKYEELASQEIEVILDVFEQTIEVNDLESLKARIKKLNKPLNQVKSLFVTNNQQTEPNQQ